MVYLREILKQNRDKILAFNNLETATYLSITNPEKLSNTELELTNEEQVAYKGFKAEEVTKEELEQIINKKPVKGVSAVSNLYKLLGLYHCSNDIVKGKLAQKFETASPEERYLIGKIEPEFKGRILETSSGQELSPLVPIIKLLILSETLNTDYLEETLLKIISTDFDVPTQVILEDLERKLLRTTYDNRSADQLMRSILQNFPNAIKKIITDRRKGHSEFEINDEYDVQDLLYVILKSAFPELKDEDPIEKHGGKGSRIDLILREEGLLIEVKMIKEKDSNETKFIGELKIDIESYHQCPWLKKLYCFVYDPFNKTKDIKNFEDLNGKRTKQGHEFDVEVIVVS